MKTDFELELVHNPHAVLGEGPCWVEEESRLYWTDIHGKRLFVHDTRTCENLVFLTPFKTGWLVKHRNQGFLAGTSEGLYRLRFRPDPVWTPLLADEVDPVRLKPPLRLNDGIADSAGNLWFGTMNDNDHSQPEGVLYKLSPDLDLTSVDNGYFVTNGPVFLGNGMIHNDTKLRVMYRFDLDTRGVASNRQIWKTLDESRGYPDGMTVDDEGLLWCCEFGGACVNRYTSEGDLVAKIDLPVSQVTNCTFGGPELSWLFITTAREDFDDHDDEREPRAGSLWVVKNTGIRGRPAERFGREGS